MDVETNMVTNMVTNVETNVETNVTTRAQDNFYEYVNKKWLDAPENQIPPEYPRWGGFIKLHDQSLKNQIELVKDLENMKVEKLSDEQSEKLRSHLQKYVYLYVKDIIAYVTSAFKVLYTVPGMRNWLHRHGFFWYSVNLKAKLTMETI